MPQNFIDCDREQELLLPPSLREWLPADHLAWFVIDAVAEIDLEPFYVAYRHDGWGRAAFDPQMMVALLLYAYALGERSARKIERRCQEDVAFRVICGNRVPDHATIARFRARHEQALSDTFTQVLALCAQSGLVAVGLVALDGTLIAGNAAKTANRSYASIRDEVEQMLGEAAATDAAEDARLGDRRGDELPPELSDPRSRRARLRRCKEELEREQQAAEQAHADNLAWRAAWESEHGRKLGGRKPTPPDPAALERKMINTSDPDTCAMKRAGGRSVQGYNVQVVANEAQLIVAAEVHPGPERLGPARADGRRGAARAGACRCRGDDRHRARRRRLLELGADRSGAQRRQRRDHPDQGPPAHEAAQALAAPGSRGRSDRGVPLETGRQGALQKTAAVGRAGLRRHQVQPPRRPLPAPRSQRLQLRMAADRGDAQPLKALACRSDRQP
jgi:transposase